MSEQPYAEEVNYWKTSRTAEGTWIDKAVKEINRVGGIVTQRLSGMNNGVEAHMIAFEIGDDLFRIVWPVLQSKTGNTKAARVQAATMLYHDVKSRCVAAKVLGSRKSFFAYLLLDNGQVVSGIDNTELSDGLITASQLPETIDRA